MLSCFHAFSALVSLSDCLFLSLSVSVSVSVSNSLSLFSVCLYRCLCLPVCLSVSLFSTSQSIPMPPYIRCARKLSFLASMLRLIDFVDAPKSNPPPLISYVIRMSPHTLGTLQE